MYSLDELKRHREQYFFAHKIKAHFILDKYTFALRYYTKRVNKVSFALISGQIDSEQNFIVTSSKTEHEGFGKFLYYDLMSLAFPNFILSDRSTVSWKALKVWLALLSCSYVEKADLWGSQVKDSISSHLITINFKARFSWHNFKLSKNTWA